MQAGTEDKQLGQQALAVVLVPQLCTDLSWFSIGHGTRHLNGMRVISKWAIMNQRQPWGFCFLVFVGFFWVFAFVLFSFARSWLTMLFAPVCQCPNLAAPTSFHPSLFHIPLTCAKCPNKHNLILQCSLTAALGGKLHCPPLCRYGDSCSERSKAPRHQGQLPLSPMLFPCCSFLDSLDIVSLTFPPLPSRGWFCMHNEECRRGMRVQTWFCLNTTVKLIWPV